MLFLKKKNQNIVSASFDELANSPWHMLLSKKE